MRRAVVDVGSNSVLLIVAERQGEGWKTVFESSRVTGLGAGTKETGILSPSAIGSTLDAIKEAFRSAESWGPVAIAASATMAARIAKNTGEFLTAASAQGTPISVLSGEEEARLGFKSVALDPKFREFPRIATVDVGGQSTEICIADRIENGDFVERLRRSFAIGTLALIGRTLKDECPDGLALIRASKEIDEALISDLPPDSGEVIALGATGTNLVAIREGLAAWTPERVHGAVLGYGEISNFVASLCAMTIAERSKLTGIEAGREPTLPAGALILERTLYALHAEKCRVSVHGWRHAMLWEMKDERAYSSTREK